MLDRATEDALYDLFREFFRRAERERRWNLWEDVPWDQAQTGTTEALAEAVFAAYTEELFLPDYSEQTLHLLRSSRGRAWFVTRWSYEEGKHVLVLNEWLVRSGSYTDDQLKTYADELLGREKRTLAVSEPVAAMVEALVREQDELERYQSLRALAADAQNGALIAVCDQLIGDEQAHRAFFRDALLVIQKREPGLVAGAVRTLIALPEMEHHASLLRGELRIV